jgi:ArsR family transcriptional regulator
MVTDTQYQVYQKQSVVMKALSHPTRLAIIDYLKHGEKCVCDIVAHLGAERTNVSKHLSVMTGAGVLASQKQGLKVLYQLSAPCVVDFLKCVNACLRDQHKQNGRLMRRL